MCLPLKPVLSRDRRGLPNFIDEPMNGLDNEGVVQMRELFIKLKQQGKTFLVVSHNRDDIEALCDEVYEMDAGMLKKLKK